MIEVVNLSKQYGRVRAVDDLSFTVRPGQVTGFLGPNGAGKTTTMRLILGLDRPTSGRATIEGRSYASLERPLTHVGALLDAGAVHGGRTAYHHLLWLAHSNEIPESRVRQVLDLVGLESVARRRVRGFSLGMTQRLGLAAALLGDPPVLLLDEPTNGLDPEGITWMRGLLRDLARRGRAVLVSSHLMDEVARTADHLVVVARGRLVADTTVAGFVSEHAGGFVRVRTPDPERLRQVLVSAGVGVTREEGGSLRVLGADAATVGDLAAGGRVVVHEISTQQGSLEEAFMRLTAEHSVHRTGAPR